MANKSLFGNSILGQNHEGAPAFQFGPKHKLAQYAATGCLNATFYASAEAQLQTILALCGQVPAEFVARTAVYTRRHGFMKDTPALLCAALSVLDGALLKKVFHAVIDNGKMLRNFVQILRSGVVARKSLGSISKNLVREFLELRLDEELLRDSVGQSPSLADIVRMVHPKPSTASREAFYGYLLGKPFRPEALPECVRRLEAFRSDRSQPVPDVPFQLLTSMDLSRKDWIRIAQQAGWHMARMNLNTFARQGVFEDKGAVRHLANKLRDPEAIRRARVFPYQLMVAFKSAGDSVPSAIRDALQDAMELAVDNVPRVEGRVFVLPDVSGSMQSPVTGHRKGSTTAVRCVDVAALVAAAFLRRNPDAEILPFEHSVVPLRLNARDSILTNAQKLASVGGGGTNCSAPLALLNQRKAEGSLVVYVSDNESWVDAGHARGRGTATLEQWNTFRLRNPSARLACIDIQPHGTTQASERDDILNVGGFGDSVLEVVAAHARGELAAAHWVGLIESIEL